MNLAIGYVRIGRGERPAGAESVEAQRKRLEDYCKDRLGRPQIYQDEGILGAVPLNQRPQGRALVARLEQGGVDHIVAFRLDRLFSSARQACDKLPDWVKKGLTLHLVDFNGEPQKIKLVDFNGEPQEIKMEERRGRMLIAVLAGMAQWERQLIAERTAIRAENKARRRAYGPTVYGFQRAGKMLIPAPSEREVIDQIRMWRGEGWGFHRIAEELNARGVQTKRGKRWHACTIHKLLQNDLVQGL